MILKYSSMVESEVTLDEVTIDEIMRALAEMTREGMPGTSEVTVGWHPDRHEFILRAITVITSPTQDV